MTRCSARAGWLVFAQLLTKRLQETHEVISSLLIGLLEECKTSLRSLSTSAELGDVGRQLASDLVDCIDNVSVYLTRLCRVLASYRTDSCTHELFRNRSWSNLSLPGLVIHFGWQRFEDVLEGKNVVVAVAMALDPRTKDLPHVASEDIKSLMFSHLSLELNSVGGVKG